MYYYGGYSNNSNTGCGCSSGYTGGYNYPMYGNYGYTGGYGYGGGYGSGAAIVLVLFILLVIILGTRTFASV